MVEQQESPFFFFFFFFFASSLLIRDAVLQPFIASIRFRRNRPGTDYDRRRPSNRYETLNLSTIPDTDLTYEEFRRHESNVVQLYEFIRNGIPEMDDTVNNLDHWIPEKELKTRNLYGELVIAREETQKAARDRDTYASRIAQMVATGSRQSTPVEGTKKSAKVRSHQL